MTDHDAPEPQSIPEAMWGGLARDIMMWLDMQPKTPRTLFKHLERLGREIPQWLRDEPEMKNLDHVPSKGTRCVLIYKAMQAARPTLPASDEGRRAVIEAMLETAKELRADGDCNAAYQAIMWERRAAALSSTCGDKDRENLVARPSDEVREKVALALVNYDCAQTDCPALSSVEEFRFDADRDEYLGRADVALSAIPADPVAEALEPFAAFAEHAVDENGWTSNIGRERICDWFGPSEFREALAAYRGK